MIAHAGRWQRGGERGRVTRSAQGGCVAGEGAAFDAKMAETDGLTTGTGSAGRDFGSLALSLNEDKEADLGFLFPLLRGDAGIRRQTVSFGHFAQDFCGGAGTDRVARVVHGASRGVFARTNVSRETFFRRFPIGY